MLLEHSNYVQCLLIDFSIACDTIDHCVLVNKLKQLHLPNYILKWIVDFLTDRTQCTRVGLSILYHLLLIEVLYKDLV